MTELQVYPTPEQLEALQQTEHELTDTTTDERKKHYLHLTSYAVDLGADELRVLALIAERMTMGRAQYGPLNLSTDRRDHRQEAAEELLDGCVYLASMALSDE